MLLQWNGISPSLRLRRLTNGPSSEIFGGSIGILESLRMVKCLGRRLFHGIRHVLRALTRLACIGRVGRRWRLIGSLAGMSAHCDDKADVKDGLYDDEVEVL